MEEVTSGPGRDEGSLESEQLARYVRFLEGAFIRSASVTMGGEDLMRLLSDARERLCPDAVDFLSPVRSSVGRWSSASPVVVLRSGIRSVVPLDDILFFATDEDCVVVQTEQGRFPFPHSIGKTELALDMWGFFRAHRSYLVNLSRISSVEETAGGMGTVRFDTELPVTAKVSRRKVNDLLLAIGSWRRGLVPAWEAGVARGL